MNKKAILAMVAVLCANSAVALPVSSGSPIRADFNLQPLENPQFNFPAVLISYTVSFSGDFFNNDETLRIDTYESNGTFLGSDSYTNAGFGNVRGCACFDTDLFTALNNSHFYTMIYSLNGTFNVTGISALAYDDNNGYGNATGSVGVLHNVPEPVTLALFGIGLAGLGFASRRRAAN